MGWNKLISIGLLLWYLAVSVLMAQAPVDPQFWLLASILPALFVVLLIVTHRYLPLSHTSPASTPLSVRTQSTRRLWRQWEVGAGVLGGRSSRGVFMAPSVVSLSIISDPNLLRIIAESFE